jgi:2-hydroxy-3-oxopropionate reductase
VTTVAFVGLGVMGKPMASNILAGGFELITYSRRPESADDLVTSGARRATSVRDAVSGADVVITMLPDTPDVESVALGQDGIFAHAPAGAIYVDMSTIRPVGARELADVGKNRQMAVLDAPVSGGEQGAIAGSLSIMVGGDPTAFETATPVLKAMGTTIVHVGPSGSGQTVKAANQLIVAGIVELLAEGMVFLEASGADMTAAIKVLAGGMAASRVLDLKAEAMLARQFTPGFRVELHHKDLGIVLDAAREVGVATPLGALVGQLLAALRAQGAGNLDHSALLRIVEQLSGRFEPAEVAP